MDELLAGIKNAPVLLGAFCWRRLVVFLDFVEFAGEEGFEFDEHGFGVVTGGVETDFGAFAGGEHHEAHDAFAVHAFTVFFNKNVGFEFVGDADDHGGGARVDAHLVLYNKLLGCGFGGGFVHD